MIILALDFRMKHRKRNNTLPGILTGLLAGFVFIMPATMKAQTMEIGISGGVSYYTGDINPAIPYVYSKPAFGALIRYNINNRWAARFSYTRGGLMGDDLKSKAVEFRNLNFKTHLNDFALVAEFNFWDYFTGSKRNYFTPYLFGGVGIFNFRPKNFDGVDLQKHGTEGQHVGYDDRKPYNLWNVSFPFGFGFKYSLSSRLSLGLEWGMRKTFTDYIDDISKTYYTDDDPVSDPITRPWDPDKQLHNEGMQRGNSKSMDWFNVTLLSLTYKFNLYGSKKCRDNVW